MPMKSLNVAILLLLASVPGIWAGTPWNAGWIWTPLPVREAWFRKTLEVPNGITLARIAITADDSYELHVNGATVGSGDDWTKPACYDITTHLTAGRNVIAVRSADAGAGASGLLAEGVIIGAGGQTTSFGTDTSWRCSPELEEGWTLASFDDRDWRAAQVLGPPPRGPWGHVEHPALVPLVALETLSVDWPANVRPGQTIAVTCRVRLREAALADSPLALRLVAGNDIVCEQWVQPAASLSSWKVGTERQVVFRGFRVPAYCPSGSLRAQVASTATESIGSCAVAVGRHFTGARPAVVRLSGLIVRQSGRTLEVSARSTGARAGQRYLFALMRAEEMWLAADLSSPRGRVALPDGLPGGNYDAVIYPHRATEGEEARTSVRIAGPDEQLLRPLGYGTYSDRDGVAHRWFINRAGALIWDGEPYVPCGGMFISKFFLGFRMPATDQNEASYEDDRRRLAAMKDAGVKDLYINPCVNWADRPAWVWNRIADLCEEMGMRYGIQVTNELRPLNYYDVTDEHYTVTVRGSEPAILELSSGLLRSVNPANEVLFAAFDATDDRLLEWGTAVVTATGSGVRAQANRTIPSAGPVNVHFIPSYTYTGGAHDYWTDVNRAYRSRLDGFFSSLRPGAGLRCWIDPLDNEQSFQDSDGRLLPNSDAFRTMLAEHLKAKYRTTDALVNAWAISGPLEDAGFALYSRLIPLGSPSPKAGVQHLVDRTTGRTYQVVSSRSSMLRDVRQFRDQSVGDLNSEVAQAIKKHHDVPVVLKHEGSELYTNTRGAGGFDGLGAEAYGTDREHLRAVSRAVHEQAKLCGRTMWELTTETAPAQSRIGYSDPLGMFGDLICMIEVGSKGAYCFLLKDFTGNPASDWYTFNLFEDPRQVRWLGALSQVLASAAALPDYSGRDAADDDFWRGILGLETVDLGPAFQAIRFQGRTCIWNMTEEPLTLAASRPFKVAPNAERPAVVNTPAGATVLGVEAANAWASERLWAKLKSRADLIGMDAGVAPNDWRALWARAKELEARLGDAAAARMTGVQVDGDLREWALAEPLYLKDQHDVARSRFPGTTLYTGYDSNFLYVAGSVSDSTVANGNYPGRLWDGDAVEVFLDLLPDAMQGVSALNRDCYQFLFAPVSASGKPAMSVVRPGGPNPGVPRHSLWAVTKDEVGWRFEAAISRLDLDGASLRPGRLIGFEVQLSQSDGGPRVGTKLWHGGPDAFQNRLGYGRLVLGGR